MLFFFFKQKTAYEMRISDWSSDVCSSDLFRYREAPMPDGGVSLFISQSGETIDTLEALRYARRCGQQILSLVNVAESAIARESHAVQIGRASCRERVCQYV